MLQALGADNTECMQRVIGRSSRRHAGRQAAQVWASAEASSLTVPHQWRTMICSCSGWRAV